MVGAAPGRKGRAVPGYGARARVEGQVPAEAQGRAGAGRAELRHRRRSPYPGSADLLVFPAADEPDDCRAGPDAGVGGPVGTALVGGRDPQEQPELVAGGRRGRERRGRGWGLGMEGGREPQRITAWTAASRLQGQRAGLVGVRTGAPNFDSSDSSLQVAGAGASPGGSQEAESGGLKGPVEAFIHGNRVTVPSI